jgi:hypothetical protein
MLAPRTRFASQSTPAFRVSRCFTFGGCHPVFRNRYGAAQRPVNRRPGSSTQVPPSQHGGSPWVMGLQGSPSRLQSHTVLPGIVIQRPEQHPSPPGTTPQMAPATPVGRQTHSQVPLVHWKVWLQQTEGFRRGSSGKVVPPGQHTRHWFPQRTRPSPQTHSPSTQTSSVPQRISG